MTPSVVRAAAALVFALGLGSCDSGEGPIISDPYLLMPLPGHTTAVGYLTLKNTGAERLTLEAVHSPAASSIEVHTYVREGDLLRMRPLGTLSIGPGETTALEPGGHHLMIFNFSAADASSVPITLVFAGQPPRTVQFAVRSRGSP